MAIHVLMAKAFNLWRDYYYWGQSRLGSLLPLMAFVPWKLGADALWSVSIMQYVLATTAIALFAWLSKSWTKMLLFAVMVLLPPALFEVVLLPGHPYLPQLMLILLSIAVAQQWQGDFSPRGLFWLAGFWLVGLCSAWVSDMALITTPIVLAWRIFNWSGGKLALRQHVLRWAMVPIGALAMVALIKLLKMNTTDYSGYVGQRAVSPMEVFKAMATQANAVWATVSTMQGMMWSTAIYTAMLLLFVGLGLGLMVKKARDKGWHTVLSTIPGLLVALALAMWAVTLFSGWAHVNGYPMRYFVPSVYCLLMAMLASDEHSVRHWAKVKVGLVAAMGLLALVGWYGRKHDHWKYVNTPEARAELRQMGSSALFGAYWYVYAMAAQNANELVPMPVEGEFARNGHQLWQVWECERFYVCRNGLFETFPDTITQYGATFARIDQAERTIGNAHLAQYRPIGNLPKAQ